MELNEEQAIKYLAEGIDGFHRDLSSQHNALELKMMDQYDRLEKRVEKMSNEIKELRQMNTRVVFMIAGVIVTLAVNVVVMVLS